MTANSQRIPKLIVGYFPGWAIHARNYHVSDIPVSKLTHINYAFAGVSDSGECVSINLQDERINFPALQLLKQQQPNLKTLISVGGVSHSGNFSKATINPATRQSLAQSCVSFMKVSGFDGIDMHWEFPEPKDKQHFTVLLKELRNQLDIQGNIDGKHYLLTAALPAGPDHYANFELSQIHQYLDWINLMAYDFYTSLSPQTEFSAPLYASSSNPETDTKKRLSYNVNASVRAYLSAGVPAAKLVVGVPFFGHGWEGVPNINNGLYQLAISSAQGTWKKDGVFDFKDLASNYVGTYLRFWNAEALAPYLYNPDTGIMISYDDEQSLNFKADYIVSNNLAGVMIWQLSADDSKFSLLNALSKILNPSTEPVASQTTVTIPTNSSRSITKATLVPLDAPVPTEGGAIVKFGYIQQLSLQPGEIDAIRRTLITNNNVLQLSEDLTTNRFWDLVTSFEGQSIPSLLPSASEFAGISTTTLQSFSQALMGLRKQAIDHELATLNPTGSNVGKAQHLLNLAAVANKGFAINSSVSPIGMLNLERIEMVPAGIERGELIATIPLAPGERTAVAQKEWSVTSKEFTSIVTDSLENYSETGVTDNTELAQATTSQTQHANQFNITGTVSGGIPLISGSITSSFGSQGSSSQSASDSRKHTVALIQKASSRSKQEHKVTISTTTVSGTSETTTRELVNPSMTDPIRIDYFSMMRKWQLRLYRYGLRLTYDIVIPEPGGALRKAYADLDTLRKQIGPFTFDVKYSDITTQLVDDKGILTTDGSGVPKYEWLASQYGAQVPLPPEKPGPILTPGGQITGLDDSENWHFFQLSFTVPDGYWISSVAVDAHIGIGKDYGANAFGVEHVFYKHDGRQDLHLEQPGYSPDGLLDSFLKRSIGNQTVTFFLQWCNVGWVGMTITTEPTNTRQQQWQIDVWNALYNAAQTQYYTTQQEIAAKISQIEDQLNNVDTLTLRREESDEIMKGVLRFLLGPEFNFMPQNVIDAIIKSGSDVEPKYGVAFTGNALGLTSDALSVIRQHEDKIRFINQAIEWENVVSFLYSYFWDLPDSWNFIRQIRHPDANRQAFLRAGAARVVLTIRKGWEESWVRFTEGGFKDAPISDTHPYLTIAKEIAAYDNRNYPGIPPANLGRNAIRLEDTVYTTSTTVLMPLPNGSLTNVEIEVESSAGFLLGAQIVIDSKVDTNFADNFGRQEMTTITAIRDATHMTIAEIKYSHGGRNISFPIVQPGDKGEMIAEWNEYTPTSGTDIAVTSNLATIV